MVNLKNIQTEIDGGAIIFNKTEFYCTQHGARFSLTGAGLNTFGKNGLTIYKVATDGNTAIVY